MARAWESPRRAARAHAVRGKRLEATRWDLPFRPAHGRGVSPDVRNACSAAAPRSSTTPHLAGYGLPPAHRGRSLLDAERRSGRWASSDRARSDATAAMGRATHHREHFFVSRQGRRCVSREMAAALASLLAAIDASTRRPARGPPHRGGSRIRVLAPFSRCGGPTRSLRGCSTALEAGPHRRARWRARRPQRRRTHRLLERFYGARASLRSTGPSAAVAPTFVSAADAAGAHCERALPDGSTTAALLAHGCEVERPTGDSRRPPSSRKATRFVDPSALHGLTTARRAVCLTPSV